MEHDASQPATKTDIAALAASTQREFVALRAEVASKEDVGRILQAVADVDLHITAVASTWREDFDALKTRVAKIEQHLKL